MCAWEVTFLRPCMFEIIFYLILFHNGNLEIYRTLGGKGFLFFPQGFFLNVYYFERKMEKASKEGTERKGVRAFQAGSVVLSQSPTWGSISRTAP